jgi:hypothetical protein
MKQELEYWAATEDLVKLSDSMKEKIRVWREWANSRGLLQLWAKKLKNYYGISEGGNTSQDVTKGGSEGELNLIKINDLHSLVQDQLVIVTSQRPAGIAKAINSDPKNLASAKIAEGVAEYYMASLGLESIFVQCAEIALLCDEAYLDLYWDKQAGTPIAIDPDTNRPEMSGDPVVRIHAPWNVTRDPVCPVAQQKWKILSLKANKYDLAAAYPKFRERILTAKNDSLPTIPMNHIPDGSDMMWFHLLVHDRTPALESGRYTVLIGDDIVADMELPYQEYPIERMAPSDVIDGSLGYAPSTDILAAEQVTDALHSIIVTNQVNFGGQTIVGPSGVGLNYMELAKGMRYIELPPDMVDKLKPLALTKTAPEIFQYLQVLGQKKEKAVGSVQGLLAQQATQAASGSSMALIQAQAISYNSGTQRSYFALLSGAMTKLIGILRTYADTPRIARIVGKTKSPGLKEFQFTGQDLNAVSSITYELVNPASQTYGGKLTMAQDLIKAGMITNPNQYINVVTTGQIEVLTQDDEKKQMLILQENEALMDGRPAKAVISENHQQHIESHGALLTQEAKENDPELVARVLEHIQDHLNQWMQASVSNPGILFATKQQPLPLPQMMGPQTGPGGGGPELPGGENGIPALGGGPESPVMDKAENVREPGLPNLPGTNEKPTVPGVTETGPM